jgi:hypothetical protein
MVLDPRFQLAEANFAELDEMWTVMELAFEMLNLKMCVHGK